MINYFLNGEPKQVSQVMTIDLLIEQWHYNRNSIAIAVNETFIPRSAYHSTEISEGDRIEVVGAMQGG